MLKMSNSHDGTSSFMAGLSHIRIACTNAMKMAFRGAVSKWVARHTITVSKRHEEAIRMLGFAAKYQEQMTVEIEQMAVQKIDIVKFAETLFPFKGDEKEESVKMRNVEEQRYRLISLHNEKDDLSNFRGTAWGAYSAVSDLLSNTKPLREMETSKDRKLEGFFDGYPLLNKAQDILLAA